MNKGRYKIKLCRNPRHFSRHFVITHDVNGLVKEVGMTETIPEAFAKIRRMI